MGVVISASVYCGGGDQGGVSSSSTQETLGRSPQGWGGRHLSLQVLNSSWLLKRSATDWVTEKAVVYSLPTGGWKSKIKAWAVLVPREASLLGL